MKGIFWFGEQELPEVERLEEIQEEGYYAVEGFSVPVSVEAVTERIEERVSKERPEFMFFTGKDGRRYSALEVGAFL